MERGSDKHSPRVDEQLEHEVSALVHGSPDEGRTEARRQEDGPAAGTDDGAHRHDVGPPTDGLEEEDLDLRAEVAARLADADFPATTEQLRQVANHDHAPGEVLAFLDRLPPGQTFAAVGEVWRAGGGAVEHPA